MSTSSSIDSQIGIKAETTFGTYIAVDRFYEFTQENLTFHMDRMDSMGIRTGRRTQHRRSLGAQWVDGGFTMEMPAQGTALLLKHAFGGNVTAGSGPYTHTATPGALDALSLTVQVNRPDIGGTDRVFSYLGCSITDWELSCAVGGFLMGTFNVYGTHEDTSQSKASASYTANTAPFTFLQGVVTIAGTEFEFTNFTTRGENNLATGRHRASATTPARPRRALENDLRSYTASLTGDFNALTNYARYASGAEASVVATFTSGTHSLVITQNMMTDGTTPPVNGRGILEHTLELVAMSSLADATTITAVTTNADSAA